MTTNPHVCGERGILAFCGKTAVCIVEWRHPVEGYIEWEYLCEDGQQKFEEQPGRKFTRLRGH